MKVGEQLGYLARRHGMSASAARAAVRAWTERLDVAGRLNDDVQKLSLENQQRLPEQNTKRGRAVESSIGWSVGEPQRAAIAQAPPSGWSPTSDADGGVRDGAQAADLTGLLTLAAGRTGCGDRAAGTPTPRRAADTVRRSTPPRRAGRSPRPQRASAGSRPVPEHAPVTNGRTAP
jgi:hypothetical protein